MSFSLQSFVVEEEYGFDLFFEIWSSLTFSTYDGNSCHGGDCCFFVSRIFFGAYVRPEGQQYGFCEKKS